jgi:prepilin-type N-terminal cleavage/methylation domain-containing protein
MRQRVRALRGDQSGFTLIELLIVIVILGVLAGVVVFAVSGISDRGKTAACKAEIATVQTADEAYFAQKGFYADDKAPITTLQGAGLLNASTDFKDTDVKVTNIAGPPASFTIVGGTSGPCA